MAIRITLEYGHASMVRSHLTPEGYTHDWEVFVRGVDNADIHQYIDKVVFHLHESFRNPKRVLKEPPFMVKESGYAGFLIPIEIYLKNKDEPKKFQIAYDLDLQQSGPPINNVLRHTEIITSPSDEFRKKLLRGGAISISNRDGLLEKGDTKSSTMTGKPKLSSSSEAKKHRISEPKTSNSFHDLFGPPIKTAKISPDNKKTIQLDKNSVPKPLAAANEKSDKLEKTKAKESPHKESRKDKDEKKDKKVRDSSRDKFKSKEKSKRPPSPGSKSHSSPVSKRSTSPVVTKKSSSPLPPSTKRPPSPKSKEKELKKIAEKEKDNKEKDKIKNNPKSVVDSSKSERKKDKKKHKEDKDKEKRDRYKETEKANVKEIAKITEKKPEKTDKIEKSEKDKSQEYKLSSKDGKKSPKLIKENDKIKDDKLIKTEKTEKIEKPEKVKDSKNEKDKQKHKHKKRDKKEKRDNNKDKDRKEKHDRNKDIIEKQNMPSAPSGNSLSTLLAEIPERDSSDSTPSVDDDLLSENKSAICKDTEHLIPNLTTETTKPLSPNMSIEIKKERSDRNRRDKSKGNRSEERESRKRKRRSESKGDDEVQVKREKDRGHSTSPPLEPVSSSQSPVAVDADFIHHSEKEIKKEIKKEKDSRDVSFQAVKEEKDSENDAEQVAPDSTNNTLVDTDIPAPSMHSEDYVSQLKDLQQKIMTLQDNQELQRVVQVIAETGQYEITKKTFDFDLCALDRRTVQRLQQFFSAS